VRLNRAAGHGPVVVDDALFDLLRLCRDLHARTGGAFDLTTTPLSGRWGFAARRPLPSAERRAARALVMDAGAGRNGRTVRFPGRNGAEPGAPARFVLGRAARSQQASATPAPPGERVPRSAAGARAGRLVRSQVRGDRPRVCLRDAAWTAAPASSPSRRGTRYGHPRSSTAPRPGVLSASVRPRRRSPTPSPPPVAARAGLGLRRHPHARARDARRRPERPRLGHCPGATLEGA
jgi:hypothetical protein